VRASLVVLGALMLSLAPPAAPGADAAAAARGPDNFAVQKLADGVYAVVRQAPPGLMCDGNSAFLVGDDGVVVVDCPEASREVLAALRRVTDRPVRYVINTHWHDDHIIGNQVYRDAFHGVEFIAHAATRAYLPGPGAANRQQMIAGAPQGVAMLRERLAQGENLQGERLSPEERASYESDIALVEHYLAVVPGAEIVLPTITVEDRLTLHLGERDVEVRAVGRGHTGGDLVVYLPRERIVMSGDLVVWPVPLTGREQSHIHEWGAALDSLRALRPAALVPGHGPVLYDDSYLTLMAELFNTIARQTDAAVVQGKTLEETRSAVDLTELRRRFAGDSQLRGVLFDTYVAGPGVAAAYREAKEAGDGR
jgi:glyoxylase-like metal-dependent hydrolase (beta-lactamase superfamily II)